MSKLFTAFLLLLAVKESIGQNTLSQLVLTSKPSIFSITTYDQKGIALSYGTGFFIDTKGTSVSNYHVFEGASKATIKTLDGSFYTVNNVLAQSENMDIIKFSVNKIAGKIFPYLKLAQYKPKEGEDVFVIGNPQGLEYSVSNGIVSSLRYFDEVGQIIQITTPISSGNSGSPLINMKGEVLGIVSFTLTEGQNLNFAMSISNLSLLDSVNALVYPKKKSVEAEVHDNSFKRFEWGTTVNSVLQNESMTLEEKKAGDSFAPNDYYITYLGDLFSIGISAEFEFENNALKSIFYIPKNYTIDMGEFNLVSSGTTNRSEALSDCILIENKMRDILGDNFEIYSAEMFDYNTHSNYDLPKENNISEDFYYCLNNSHTEFYFEHAWDVRSNNTRYVLRFYKMKISTNRMVFYNWNLNVKKLR